jgi:hypothetical protein
MMKLILACLLSLVVTIAKSQSIEQEKMKVTAGKLLRYLQNGDSVAILELHSDALDSVKQRKKYFKRLSQFSKQIRVFQDLTGNQPAFKEQYSFEKLGRPGSFSRLDVTVFPVPSENEKRRFFTVIIMFWPSNLHTSEFIYSFDFDVRRARK